MRFVVARGAYGGPRLMHMTTTPYGDWTACGLDIGEWSRGWLIGPIPVILCKKCAKYALQQERES